MLPVVAGYYDNNHPALLQSGTWSDVEIPRAVGGRVTSTSELGASIGIEAVAPAVTLYYVTAADGATVDLCTGAVCQSINTAGSDGIGRATLQLDQGINAITIGVTGVGTFYFDGVYVHPDLANIVGERPERQTITYTYDGEGKTGYLDSTITAGETLIALLLTVQVIVMMILFVVQVWGQRRV